MSAWRFTAAAAALCLFACSTTASAKLSGSVGPSPSPSAQDKKQKISSETRPRKHAIRERSRRTVAHRRLRRHAQLHRARRLVTRASSLHQYNSHEFSGTASYYFEGQRVASGGRFDPDGMTAAHRTLPFGTRVHVTDLNSGRSVDVTINDRGPFVHGRVLDLSRGAAQALGMMARGITRIRASVI